MTQSMGTLNEKMDEIMINNNMMNQLMQQNDGVETAQVGDMMNVLKQEIAMEETNNLGQDIAANNHYNNVNKQQEKQVYGNGGGNNQNNNNSKK